jgi:putative addiction module component (TIGR02574 family)
MTTQIEMLEAEALRLPAAERALLVQALVASLDEDSAVEDAWAVEVDRRLAQIEAGEVNLVPGRVALDKLKAKFA